MKQILIKLKEACLSVLPITIIVLILCATPLVNIQGSEILGFTICAIFLIIGIGLFTLGADMAMTPIGENVGTGITKSKRLSLLLIVCFIMGLLITIAEPDLSVLAGYVKDVINSSLLKVTVSVGVGLFLVIGVIKIATKKNLSYILMFFYMLMFALCALLFEMDKGSFLSMAFDSGGVTTGPITVPFIMALGVGIASTIGGKNAHENSFGLVSLCSVGPIIAVLFLSLIAKGDMSYTPNYNDYSMAYAIEHFFHTVLEKIGEISLALGLIIIFFIILQITVLKLPKDKIIKIAIGIVYTFFGLLIFLTAVKIGFVPVGYAIGQQLSQNSKILFVILGIIFGMVVVLAEPAVHVLNKQVEEITGGGVSKKQMLIALCIGVGLAIGLSAIRIIFNFSVLYYLIPGYIISLGLSFFIPHMYTAIAFDSGGVVSGPLTSSFILPFALGACDTLCSNEILSLGFGIVALVAMIPLITIQSLGFKAILTHRVKEKIALRRIISSDDETIINFNWEE